jgi:predicted type IV restriction endonuclease
MTDLGERLCQAEKWLDRYEPQGKEIGEANTKVRLIAPILEGPGWDIHDPDEVHHEYRR